MSKKVHDEGGTEESSVKGNELIEKVMALIKQGTVRQLIIRKSDGKVLLKVPVTAGLVVGGFLLVMAPIFTALASVTALLSEVKIEVIRKKNDEE